MMNNEDLKFNFGCASCGYKNSEAGKPSGKIDIMRIIEKLDSLFDKNDLTGAGRLLDYWKNEAVALSDKQGELSIVSEQTGYYRKTGEKEKGLAAVLRATELIDILGVSNEVSSATVYLNCATTLKAFGKAEEAIPLYERALSVYKEKLDENNPLFGGFYNNYGLALTDLEKYGEAENAYLAAISVMEKQKDGKPEEAITYINLAHLYEKTCPEKIYDCLEKAKQLLEDPDIPRDGYYAFVLSKCAPSYRYFGKVLIAENMERQVKEIYERS